MTFYQINTGEASARKGAIGPRGVMIALRSALNINDIVGDNSDNTYMPVPTDKEARRFAEDLLNHHQMVWSVVRELPKKRY